MYAEVSHSKHLKAAEQQIERADQGFAMRSEIRYACWCTARRDADESIDEDDVLVRIDADDRREPAPGSFALGTSGATIRRLPSGNRSDLRFMAKG
jgi:hypothetical protein